MRRFGTEVQDVYERGDAQSLEKVFVQICTDPPAV